MSDGWDAGTHTQIQISCDTQRRDLKQKNSPLMTQVRDHPQQQDHLGQNSDEPTIPQRATTTQHCLASNYNVVRTHKHKRRSADLRRHRKMIRTANAGFVNMWQVAYRSKFGILVTGNYWSCLVDAFILLLPCHILVAINIEQVRQLVSCGRWDYPSSTQTDPYYPICLYNLSFDLNQI